MPFIAAYSLIELLTVIAIVGSLTAFAIPAFVNWISNAAGGEAASAVADALAVARSHAITKSTHVAVGFDDASTSSSSGNRQLRLSVVASKDGTLITGDTPAGSLILVTRPLKIDQVCLTASTPLQNGALATRDSSGTVIDFLTSGTVTSLNSPDPRAPKLPRWIQFDPRGSARTELTAGIPRIIEIGIMPLRGGRNQEKSASVIQLSGITGVGTVYRP